MPLQQWRVTLFERDHFWSYYYLLWGFPSSSVGKCRRPQFDSWVGKIHWRRGRLLVFLGISGGSNGKESTCNAGDLSLIPGSGRFPGEGNGSPFQWDLKELDVTEWFSLHFTLLSPSQPEQYSLYLEGAGQGWWLLFIKCIFSNTILV